MSGEVVREWHLGHVTHVFHEILSTVGVSAGQQREQTHEDGWPCSIVGSEHVVDVNTTLKGHSQKLNR